MIGRVADRVGDTRDRPRARAREYLERHDLDVERDTRDVIGPISDVQMMMVCNEGRERSRADFERLFERAGFQLRRVVPTATLMSIVEGVAT